MAEFCPKCWNKIYKRNDSAGDLILSKEQELCEGCGKYKRVVIARRGYEYGLYTHPVVRMSEDVIRGIFSIIKRLVIFLYRICKQGIKKDGY